jgi:hypothetical protein
MYFLGEIYQKKNIPLNCSNVVAVCTCTCVNFFMSVYTRCGYFFEYFLTSTTNVRKQTAIHIFLSQQQSCSQARWVVFVGTLSPSINPTQWSRKDSGQCWEVGKICHNFDGPYSWLRAGEGQRYFWRSPGRRLQYATWHHLAQSTVYPKASHFLQMVTRTNCGSYENIAQSFIIIIITAIGLSPGGSSPTLVQKKIKVHKTTKQL